MKFFEGLFIGQRGHRTTTNLDRRNLDAIERSKNSKNSKTRL
jgi:hypothetical protein